MIYQKALEFGTKGRSILDITDAVDDLIQGASCKSGLCHLFIQHTSASLILCENADPMVRKDLERFMQHLVPDGDPMFQHKTEGPDDMPAHLRTVITHSSITIPVHNHHLALGTWQGIYLWEHRNAKFRRKVYATVMGEG